DLQLARVHVEREAAPAEHVQHALHGEDRLLAVAGAVETGDQAVAGELVRADTFDRRDVLEPCGRCGGCRQDGEREPERSAGRREGGAAAAPASSLHARLVKVASPRSCARARELRRSPRRRPLPALQRRGYTRVAATHAPRIGGTVFPFKGRPAPGGAVLADGVWGQRRSAAREAREHRTGPRYP